MYRFGLSIQKRIWEEVDRNPEKFCHRVGWNALLSDISNFETSINFSLSAPEGHLPVINFQKNKYNNDSLHLLEEIFSCFDTFFPTTNPYPILLKGLPNSWADLQLQAIGTGVLDLRLYLDEPYDHLFYHQEIFYSGDKDYDQNVISIPLPPKVLKKSLSGSLIFKSSG
ncbi:MAG: GUN4 domain-containing protein [Nostoc sp.]|uniref:GUN4 domain-containing protein n=1 Tax=Nostoc sp. TaxID=1180 RepID=UPI002FFC2BFA